MADVERLIHVLHELVESGNSVVVIEHNLDIMAEADWLLDLGPEGGDGGGKVIAKGTPEKIADSRRSRTAPFLKAVLQRSATTKKDDKDKRGTICLLYTSPSPRDATLSRMPSSA